MALRNLRYEDDPILRKKSRVVEKIDKKLQTLIDDMLETMSDHEGVGLAAPQVGILKRVAVIDVGDGEIVLINPVILEQDGLQCDKEACLSVRGVSARVERPTYVKVSALDREGEEFLLEAEDYLAVAICHEIDHLDGILFIDKMVPDSDNEEENEEEE